MPRLIIEGKGINGAFDFSADIVTIGRAKANNLLLPDNRRISRYHAALIKLKDKDEYFIRDLGSFSSTKVNGKIVYRKLLKEGDTIEIENFKFNYSKECLKDNYWFVIIPDEVEKEEHSGNEGETIYFDFQPFPKLSNEKKEKAFLEILKHIEESSTLSEILEIVLDSLVGALSLEKIGITVYLEKIGITVNDGNKKLRSSYRGINMERGERIPIHESKQRFGTEETLFTPLKRGKEDIGFIYIEKKGSAGGLSTEDKDFLDAIVKRLCREIPKKKMEEVILEDIFDWPGRIIGNSKKMDKIREDIEKASSSDGNVLILGETGTGKELVANAIHKNSHRKNNPFEVLNCTALPKELVESELFGHVKGAFTGADRDKQGLVEIADGGTLFLDEIGDLHIEIQVKLLRFLETKEFTRLGETKTIKVDVRIIAATNKDLDEVVKKGEFREDLFYRLKQLFVIYLPSLRERREDIPLLAHFFLDNFAKKNKKNIKGISNMAMNLLWEHYDWPGNVRELENCIRGAIVKMPEGRTVIFPHDLEEIKGKLESDETADEYETTGESETTVQREFKNLKEMEKDYIEKVLRHTKGEKKSAGEILGISRPTLDKKIKDHGISIERCKEV